MANGHDVSVVAYSAAAWDTRLTLKIECRTCDSEWGWCSDENGNHARLESLVEQHKREKRSNP
jgi:hypothetical protein